MLDIKDLRRGVVGVTWRYRRLWGWSWFGHWCRGEGVLWGSTERRCDLRAQRADAVAFSFYLRDWRGKHERRVNNRSKLQTREQLLYSGCPPPAAHAQPDSWVSPVFFMGKSDLRCMVEGSSFIRSDSCRLKGEVFWLRTGKPLKEPCLAITSAGACLRGIAWGPRAAREGGGEDEGDGEPPVWCTAEFVKPMVEFPATLTSVSAVREGQNSSNEMK